MVFDNFPYTITADRRRISDVHGTAGALFKNIGNASLVCRRDGGDIFPESPLFSFQGRRPPCFPAFVQFVLVNMQCQ